MIRLELFMRTQILGLLLRFTDRCAGTDSTPFGLYYSSTFCNVYVGFAPLSCVSCRVEISTTFLPSKSCLHLSDSSSVEVGSTAISRAGRKVELCEIRSKQVYRKMLSTQQVQLSKSARETT